MGRNGNKNVMNFILQILVFSFEFLNSVFFKKNLLCPNGGAKFHLPDENTKKCFRTFFLTHAVRLFHHNTACFYLYSSQNTSVVVFTAGYRNKRLCECLGFTICCRFSFQSSDAGHCPLLFPSFPHDKETVSIEII